MQIIRNPYVPFTMIGGLEAYMEDKKYHAQKYGDQWEVVSWENGKLVCDRLILDRNETAESTLKTVFG